MSDMTKEFERLEQLVSAHQITAAQLFTAMKQVAQAETEALRAANRDLQHWFDDARATAERLESDNEVLRAEGIELAKMAGKESRKCDELRARAIETDRDIRAACAEIIEVEAEKVGAKQGLARKMCKIRLMTIAERLRGFDSDAALERQSEEGRE